MYDSGYICDEYIVGNPSKRDHLQIDAHDLGGCRVSLVPGMTQPCTGSRSYSGRRMEHSQILRDLSSSPVLGSWQRDGQRHSHQIGAPTPSPMRFANDLMGLSPNWCRVPIPTRWKFRSPSVLKAGPAIPLKSRTLQPHDTTKLKWLRSF